MVMEYSFRFTLALRSSEQEILINTKTRTRVRVIGAVAQIIGFIFEAHGGV
jgi:hypothetical protein